MPPPTPTRTANTNSFGVLGDNDKEEAPSMNLDEAAPTDPPVEMTSPASDVAPNDLPTEIRVPLPPPGGGDDKTVISGNAQPTSPSASPTNIAFTYTHHVKREMVLKWNFQPNKPRTKEAIVQQHITLLHAVMTHYVGSVEVVAPNGHDPLTPAPLTTLGRPDKYYKINYTPPRNSQPASYAIYHRIHSTVALSEIRNHASISSTLALYQCWVKLHHWKEEFQDITQLGWMVHLNPAHSRDDHVTEEIRDHIKKNHFRP
jgi:hypothetical protein